MSKSKSELVADLESVIDESPFQEDDVIDLTESANLEVALLSFEGNLDDVVTTAVVLKGIAKSALRRKQLNVSELQGALKRMSKMLNSAQTDVRNIVRAMSESREPECIGESDLASELRDVLSEVRDSIEAMKSGLVDYLKKHRTVTVSELAYSFTATPAKIEKCLASLVKDGTLKTSRGKTATVYSLNVPVYAFPLIT